MKILTRFLMRRFFTGFALVMLIVCGIIFAVTFVERLPANPDALSAMYESWVRLLEYVPLFLPLAVFMGTLLASYNLTKSSESIIVSSAGMSPYQSARPFFIGAIFSMIALIGKKLKPGTEIPFGPFIALGAIISAIWGQAIIGWYLAQLL